MSIIQEKINSGALQRWFDSRSGTFSDLTGNQVDLGTANITAINPRTGFVFNGVDDRLVTTFDGTTGDEVSVVVLFKSKLMNAGLFYVLDNSAGAAGYGLRIDATNNELDWFVYSGGATGLVTTDISDYDEGKDFVTAAGVHTTTYNRLFLNGVQTSNTNYDASGGIDTSADTMEIGSVVEGGNYFEGDIVAVLTFTEALTDTEVAQVTEELQALVWPTKPMGQSKAPQLININKPNLVGGWKMSPQGNKIIDLTSSGNDGTLVGPFHKSDIIGDALSYNGVDNYVTFGDVLNFTDDASFIITLRTTDSDGVIFSKWNTAGLNRSWNVRLATGRPGFTISSDGSNFENENALGAVNDNVPRQIGIAYDKSEDTVDFYIDGNFDSTDTFTTATGGINQGTADVRMGDEEAGSVGGFLDGDIYDIQPYDAKLEAADFAAEYAKLAATVQYKSDWGTPVSTANRTSGFLEDTGWQIDSGAWKISTDTIDGQKVKVIECVSDGILYLDTLQFMTEEDGAFGSWKFYINKTDSGSAMITLFLANTVGGAGSGNNYNLRFAADESLGVRRASGAVFIDAGTKELNTWYEIKITRRYDGLFELFVDGVSEGTSTDITVLVSKLMVLDYDAGDKIAFADVKGDHAIAKYLGII